MGKTTLALVGSDSHGREIRDIVADLAPEFGLRLIAADADAHLRALETNRPC